MEKFLMEILAKKAMDSGDKVRVTFDNNDRLPYEPIVRPVVGHVIQVEETFCQVKTLGRTILDPPWDRVCPYLIIETLEIIQK